MGHKLQSMTRQSLVIDSKALSGRPEVHLAFSSFTCKVEMNEMLLSCPKRGSKKDRDGGQRLHGPGRQIKRKVYENSFFWQNDHRFWPNSTNWLSLTILRMAVDQRMLERNARHQTIGNDFC